MNVKRYAVYADVMNLLMIELVYVSLVWYIQTALGTMVSVWIPLFYAVILSFAYVARCRIRRLSIYISVHLVLCICVVFLPFPSFEKMFIIIFAILWTIFDLMYWTGAERVGIEMLPVWTGLVFLVVFFRASVFGYTFMINVAYIGGIIYMGIFFLRLYCLNIRKFSTDKQMHEQVPIALMFAQNGKMVAILVTCFVLGMILLRSRLFVDGVGMLLQKLRELIAQFLVWMASMMPQDILEEATAGREEMQVQLIPTLEQDPFWYNLFYVLEVIVKWTMIFGFMYWVLRGIYRFYIKYRRLSLYEGEEICYDGIKETKSWLIKEHRQRQNTFFGSLTNAEKVRRIYRKKIERFAQSGYSFTRAHTPYERAEDVKQWKAQESVDELTTVYEKARYSTCEISNEEVRQAKSQKMN